MSFEQVIDLYLFLITGFGFWGALTLTRFFYFRWTNPPMKAMTIFFGILAAGLGWLMLARLLAHLSGIPFLESSPLRQVVYRTILVSGVWWLVWKLRIRWNGTPKHERARRKRV